jgi:hypothetical protein
MDTEIKNISIDEFNIAEPPRKKQRKTVRAATKKPPKNASFSKTKLIKFIKDKQHENYERILTDSIAGNETEDDMTIIKIDNDNIQPHSSNQYLSSLLPNSKKTIKHTPITTVPENDQTFFHQQMGTTPPDAVSEPSLQEVLAYSIDQTLTKTPPVVPPPDELNLADKVGGFSNKIENARRFKLEEERQTRKLIHDELETKKMMEEAERQLQHPLHLPDAPLTATPGPKKVKKTYRRSFRVGKNTSLGTVGVLIPNHTLRKNVRDQLKSIHGLSMSEIKERLITSGLIKVGSNAPDDVLRKMYESMKMIGGEVNNYNTPNILFNYLKNSASASSSLMDDDDLHGMMNHNHNKS